MNEEFKKLFLNLSEKDQKEVANLIRFKNEVKYHDKQFEELLEQYIELSRENDKLEHNWNELKKWLEETLNELKQNDIYDRTSYETGQIIATECIIAKISELEEGGNNE